MNNMLQNMVGYLVDRIVEFLPGNLRAKIHGHGLMLDKPLSKKFVLKLAQTKEELEACFRLLHDEYVAAGIMKPDPSGLRVTFHHALPTTSVLMCCHESTVIGTVSLIRENKLGFPMQQVFDLDKVFRKGGNVAEVSALAISRQFRMVRNRILMPMLKFLYEYAEYRFDTQHLVIAAHPRHMGFYENVLCFRRLSPHRVKHYDFVNGAPAAGAHLDLVEAKEMFQQKYGHLPAGKNLYHYFTAASLPNCQFPHRRFHTTTDPVMTPELIDYFFRQRTNLFGNLNAREIQLLHTLYDLPEYERYLPTLSTATPGEKNGHPHSRRFPVRCPARLRIDVSGVWHTVALVVYECSETVFCAHCERPLQMDMRGKIEMDLGEYERCTLPVEILRLSKHSDRVIMLRVIDTTGEQGRVWLKFVRALNKAAIGADLDDATRFCDDAPGAMPVRHTTIG
ncbi:MAG: hypothetical protein LBP58_04410 [Azoarcus sp.]|nr:hypothetical protein [Azoarcus sp.]